MVQAIGKICGCYLLLMNVSPGQKLTGLGKVLEKVMGLNLKDFFPTCWTHTGVGWQLLKCSVCTAYITLLQISCLMQLEINLAFSFQK